MEFDDSFHDCQAQAGAAMLERPGFLDPEELIKHSGDFSLGNAGTGIEYGNRQLVGG